MITPYGRDNAFVMLGIGGALILLALTPIPVWIGGLLIFLGVLVVAFTLWFFRDEERPLTAEAATDSSIIVAPADGNVTEVMEVENAPEVGGKAIQISIFLSPLNLHVNRYPASGHIVSATYVPGKYLMAFNPKASEENERSIFVLKNDHGTILYRQITGFLARRIVYDTQTNDTVRAGERFGMMKFGSRMDVVVPANADVLVRPGDKVTSALTKLARLKGVEGK